MLCWLQRRLGEGLVPYKCPYKCPRNVHVNLNNHLQFIADGAREMKLGAEENGQGNQGED